MKKLFDHLFCEKTTIFGPQTPSKYTFDEIALDVLATPFHIGKWLSKKRSETRPKLTKVEQKPQVIYIEKPVCQPHKSPAELMRELNAEHEAKLAECEKITDCCLRERTKALIEIDYRKRLAQLASSAIQCGNEILQDKDGDMEAPDGRPHSRVTGKSQVTQGRNRNMDGGTR